MRKDGVLLVVEHTGFLRKLPESGSRQSNVDSGRKAISIEDGNDLDMYSMKHDTITPPTKVAVSLRHSCHARSGVGGHLPTRQVSKKA